MFTSVHVTASLTHLSLPAPRWFCQIVQPWGYTRTPTGALRFFPCAIVICAAVKCDSVDPYRLMDRCYRRLHSVVLVLFSHVRLGAWYMRVFYYALVLLRILIFLYLYRWLWIFCSPSTLSVSLLTFSTVSNTGRSKLLSQLKKLEEEAKAANSDCLIIKWRSN